MIDRALWGWRVRSELPLPETEPWRGPDGPVDIEIRRGPVPPRLEDRSDGLPYLDMGRDGTLLLRAMPAARFLVARDLVIVDSPLPPNAPGWRVLLLGPVLGILCYLRGVLPLHAGVVRLGARAAGFAGPPGAGKSTLTAALCGRGHSFVTDDVCPVVSLDPRALVRTPYPALKLEAASVDPVGLEVSRLQFMGADVDKYQRRLGHGFETAPVALDLVYLLEDTPEEGEDSIVPVRGAESFERLNAEIFHDDIGRLLWGESALFGMVARLCERIVLRRLVRKRDFARLPALLRLIETDVSGDLRPMRSGDG